MSSEIYTEAAMKKSTMYLPWLGELKAREEGDRCYFLPNLPLLSSWDFDITLDRHLDFLSYPGFISPIPLVSAVPVRAIQLGNFSKDPFHASKRSSVYPIPGRWYWSPVLGWCSRVSSESTDFRLPDSLYIRDILDHNEEARLTKTSPFYGVTMWSPDMMLEIIERCPFFLSPQKFVLEPV